jgi:hypothetical protein
VSKEYLAEHVGLEPAGLREVARGISQRCVEMVSTISLHQGRVAVCFLLQGLTQEGLGVE